MDYINNGPVNININIIFGDVNGSAVVQGGNGNSLSVSADKIHEVFDVIRQIVKISEK